MNECHTMRGNRFGGGFGPVVRQNTDLMNESNVTLLNLFWYLDMHTCVPWLARTKGRERQKTCEKEKGEKYVQFTAWNTTFEYPLKDVEIKTINATKTICYWDRNRMQQDSFRAYEFDFL